MGRRRKVARWRCYAMMAVRRCGCRRPAPNPTTTPSDVPAQESAPMILADFALNLAAGLTQWL
ncbi:MAG: hypothetical protein KDE23_28085, partial [Caldilinea sp.]|nr:hypothetical protein [Caldilinea sp.]